MSGAGVSLSSADEGVEEQAVSGNHAVKREPFENSASVERAHLDSSGPILGQRRDPPDEVLGVANVAQVTSLLVNDLLRKGGRSRCNNRETACHTFQHAKAESLPHAWRYQNVNIPIDIGHGSMRNLAERLDGCDSAEIIGESSASLREDEDDIGRKASSYPYKKVSTFSPGEIATIEQTDRLMRFAFRRRMEDCTVNAVLDDVNLAPNTHVSADEISREVTDGSHGICPA